MAANQIPLLELAKGKSSKNGDKNGGSGKGSLDLALGILLKSLTTIDVEGNTVNGKIEVIAFTDPNDLLSYEIKKLENATSITNVIINNTWDFWLFEGLEGLLFDGGPFVSAHTGYLENPRVWKLILCGQSKDCSALQ